MNRQKENIDLLIGKVSIVFLFLILFILKTTDCFGGDSFNKSGAIEQIGVVIKFPVPNKTIFSVPFNNTSEQLCKVNNTASLVESVFVPTLCDAVTTFKFKAYDKENDKIINSNNKVCQLFRECKVQFIVIKPKIIDRVLLYCRTSLNDEEFSSIS